MAARYLLDCPCGERHTVEARQAGSRLTCSCGATLEVPTLRGLQALPPAETPPDQAAVVWTLRHSVVTAAVLVSVLLLGMGLWAWRQERELQKHRASLDFTEELVAIRDSDVQRDVQQWSPLVAWQYWEFVFKPQNQAGFVDQNAPFKANAEAAIQAKRTERWVWWGAAAVVLAVVLTWAKFAPR